MRPQTVVSDLHRIMEIFAMWLIVGTLPEAEITLECGPCRVANNSLFLPSGRTVPVERGTAVLLAASTLACELLGIEVPYALLSGDIGNGAGSKKVYRYLTEHSAALRPRGVTFHYLFPDVDWHNKVLMALHSLHPCPQLVADAGFMYVAKMSGYADQYTLFTPDAGEMAFLADEHAPHPFYTRGFLLEGGEPASRLLDRAHAHGNCPPYLLMKGATDYVAKHGKIVAEIATPNLPAMEAIGGTGDLVTALATVFLMRNETPDDAALYAAQTIRHLAALANPTPATQVGELLRYLSEVLLRG